MSLTDFTKDNKARQQMMHTIGTTLFELRKRRQLTQRQLCDKLNINRTSYSYYENNLRVPDLETAAILAEFYGISIDELVQSDWRIDMETEDSIKDKQRENERMLQYLKQMDVDYKKVQSITKSDFLFLEAYKELSPYDQSELQHIVRFKLQNKHEP